MSLVAAVAAVLLGGAPPAAAHSELEASNPADGSTVATLPAEIKLTFDDSVLPQYVTVAAEIDGEAAQKLKTQVTRSEVRATPPTLDNQAEQAWKVSYRIVSRDGHVVTGAIAFSVRAQPTPSPRPRPRTASPTQASPPSDGTAAPTSTATPTLTPPEVPTPDDPPSERAIVLGASILGLVLIAPLLLIAWRRRRISDD